MRARRLPSRLLSTLPAVLVAIAALIVIDASDSWRIALLAVIVAAAIAATRVRYALLAGAALLVAVALLAATGHTAGTDDRPGARSAATKHHHAQGHHDRHAHRHRGD